MRWRVHHIVHRSGCCIPEWGVSLRLQMVVEVHPMAWIRHEVRSRGAEAAETLRWYATAVEVMQSRPLADSTSWWYLAAIHGFHGAVWQAFGVIDSTEPLPSASVVGRVWNQCQHQSWYFLPWHRGYLAAFEQIAREAVVSAGGPADWAVPYWDYSAAHPPARELPEAFAARTRPDGSPNPLWVERRFGSGVTPIEINEQLVSLAALGDPQFTGGPGGVPPGFGGPRTLFHHGPESDSTNGRLESLPHNVLHTALGGSRPGTDPLDWQNVGLMSMPITAALDPIFWLHHANIDRLWSVWQRSNADPTDPNWLDGPANRAFVMPRSDGTEWTFTARTLQDTSAEPLGYVYDDEPSIEPADEVIAAALPRDPEPRVREGAAMDAEPTPELIGASDGGVHVEGETPAAIRIDDARAESLRSSPERPVAQDAADGAADDSVGARALRAATQAEPRRVFIKLEGIHGASDAALYHVYIDVPADPEHTMQEDRLAGTVSLFGVAAASDPDGPEGGGGLNQVLEITQIVDELNLSGDDLTALDIRFVPVTDAVADAAFDITRVGVFVLEP